MNKVLSFAYSTVFHMKTTHIFHVSSNKISQHNLNFNIPYRSSTAHALHSFCIQARQTLSAMFLHCSHPHHNSLLMHINIHYTPSTTHPIAFHNPPLHTPNKHKAYSCKWQQNGTRCKEGVKSVVVSFPSSLVDF